MELNKEVFRKRLFESEFESNYNRCARLLGVKTPQVHRILNSNSQAGPKFLGRLRVYCDKNGYDFDEFIFLPKS